MSSRKEKSDRESSPESDDEGGNTFANDGSFLEMFKRRMEEQKRQEKAKSELGAAGHASTGKSSTAKTSTSATKPSLSSATEVPKASVNKPYQGVVGKRKALMKSIELREKRKRKREELEEQQLAEEEEGKGSAWKAYLSEVKAYEKRSCKDPDDYKRPLVK